MSIESEQRAQDALERAVSRILAMSKDDFDHATPAQVTEMLRALRQAKHDAEATAARAAAQVTEPDLDWGGHVPTGAPQDDPAGAPAEVEAPEPGAPARPPLEERLARLREEEWNVLPDSIRFRLESGRGLPRFPSAAEYRTWSDEWIARLRQDPESLGLDDEGWPVSDDPSFWDDESLETLDQHPLNLAVERAEQAQQAWRRAQASRIQAMLAVHRTERALAEGTGDAAVNGVHRNAMLLQLAHTFQMAEQTAAAFVDAADDLSTRLPGRWARFAAGEVPWRGMQIVHGQMDGLAEEHWAAYDEKAARAVVRVAMPELRSHMHDVRERLQATTAVDRHEKALATRRVTIEPAADRMAWIQALLPAAEAVFIDLALDAQARAAAGPDDETRGISQLRADILTDWCAEGIARNADPDVDGVIVPRRKGVQAEVGLLIPAMTALGHSDVPARLEGYGPIDIETAKRLAGGATSWTKVLSDPVSGAIIDIGREKYRPTADMRKLLGFLDRGGRGPNCPRPPSRTEADHVEPVRQGFARGRTALDNLVLLARRDHRIKTSGDYEIELREHRDLAWTSWYGTRIITTVEPLEPTPTPEHLLQPSAAPGTAEWAADGRDDELDCPF